MLIITGIARHTVRYPSNQSRRYAVNLRTTLHCSNNSLGIMVCIHHGEHVPTIINLLEDSNSTKLSAILIFVLHLTDLTRHAVASLVPHPPPENKVNYMVKFGALPSFINDFKASIALFNTRYEQHHQESSLAALQLFLVGVQYLDQRHQLGGACLSVMRISFTLVRFKHEKIQKENRKSYLKNELMHEYGSNAAMRRENYYREETVTDGSERTQIKRWMEDGSDFVMLGWYHDQESPLTFD